MPSVKDLPGPYRFFFYSFDCNEPKHIHWRLGMNTVASPEPRIKTITVTEDAIIADLVDGRIISVPLVWSWRLSEATPEQRANYEIMGAGQGVHWPELDEDLSAEGMLHGMPARRPKQRV